MNKVSLYDEIKQGNIAAFEILFREFYPSMCVIARKYTEDKQAAEDIAQEVFIHFWEKRKDYATIPDLKTFLYVSVRNLSFNYLRDKKKTVDCTTVELADQDISFHETLIQEETYRLITKAIHTLPHQSSKIMQFTLEGKQNKEIAEILGISVSTVKTLKYNALKILKVNLKGYFPLLLILLFNHSKD